MIYGLEELGRLLILKDRIVKAEEKELDYIKLRGRREDVFYHHAAKQELALMNLPENAEILHIGDFGEGFGRGFDTDVKISQELREDLNFVDYIDGYWTNPVRIIDKSKLSSCIKIIEESINKEAT